MFQKQKPLMPQKNINVDGLDIELTRRKMKHLRLRIVPPDGAIKVSCPLRESERNVIAFIRDKKSWIRAAQIELLKQPRPTQKPEGIHAGDICYFFGNPLHIDIQHADRRQVIQRVDNKVLIIHSPTPDSAINNAKQVDTWYRNALKKDIPQLINQWEKRIGVNTNAYGIKKMKTKWGSCNIQAKRIWLNLELAKYPKECLEYVIVHELVHLLERYHNARFYHFMDHFLPDWKKHEQRLQQSP